MCCTVAELLLLLLLLLRMTLILHLVSWSCQSEISVHRLSLDGVEETFVILQHDSSYTIWHTTLIITYSSAHARL